MSTSFTSKHASKLLVFILLGMAFPGYTQTVPVKVAVANGGIFGDLNNNANILLYDPSDGSTISLDTIHTQSIQDLLIEDRFAYVAAQDSIVKYDLARNKRIAANSFGSLSTISLGLYNDYLLVGNFYGSSDNNFRIFDKNTLTFIDSIAEVDLAAKDFAVWGDTAYVAQNYTTSSFTDSAGYLTVVDLKNRAFVRNIFFDNNDEDLGRLLVMDSVIYGLNSASETITLYDIRSGVSATVDADVDVQTAIYGSQTAFLGNPEPWAPLIFPFDDGLGIYDLASQTILDIATVDTQVTAFAFDQIDSLIYLTQTDYFSYKKGGIYDLLGNKKGSFQVGDAPEAIAVVYNLLPLAIDDQISELDNLLHGVFLPLENDMDSELDSLSIRILTGPDHGSIQLLRDTVFYEANATFQGGDLITYEITDLWGATDTAVISISLSVGEDVPEPLHSSFNIFPNPVSSSLILQGKDLNIHIGEIRIRDISGNTLMKFSQDLNVGTIELNIDGLPSGLYLLDVNSEKGRYAAKFIKL